MRRPEPGRWLGAWVGGHLEMDLFQQTVVAALYLASMAVNAAVVLDDSNFSNAS